VSRGEWWFVRWKWKEREGKSGAGYKTLALYIHPLFIKLHPKMCCVCHGMTSRPPCVCDSDSWTRHYMFTFLILYLTIERKWRKRETIGEEIESIHYEWDVVFSLLPERDHVDNNGENGMTTTTMMMTLKNEIIEFSYKTCTPGSLRLLCRCRECDQNSCSCSK